MENSFQKTARAKKLFYLVLLFCLAFSPYSSAAQQTKQKLILDTDIGDDIDDAWALAFVISHLGHKINIARPVLSGIFFEA